MSPAKRAPALLARRDKAGNSRHRLEHKGYFTLNWSNYVDRRLDLTPRPPITDDSDRQDPPKRNESNPPPAFHFATSENNRMIQSTLKRAADGKTTASFLRPPPPSLHNSPLMSATKSNFLTIEMSAAIFRASKVIHRGNRMNGKFGGRPDRPGSRNAKREFVR